MPPSQPVWLFDLDDTLHRADAGIFRLINCRMTEFMARELSLSLPEASDLREHYWRRYGATLGGLQQHHPQVCPAEFLRQSHHLPELIATLQPMPHIDTALAALPGRKAVFSNGPAFYVRALIDAMRLGSHFEALFGVNDLALHYKPQPQAFHMVCTALAVPPPQCVLVDDSPANLQAAKALGLRTVWFGNRAQPQPCADHIARDMCELPALAGEIM
ncbi:pyrimidine 5'-nucleotidase [Eikenella sp. NML96-A-049]|uniref:pyrimidine 5'-nucleotidase n=1 Tax=unclassified Eikenella TaxID=2639367 RepID=UPI0007E0313C|nr:MULTISPECIES: pyrimidine 5'-nucleotidase [unclassified Eikenella]OAM33659.1 pyrimidine 5'-nucleotidase [Eikenella sp. NML070372]OAM41660.1 pyrimidine 5'-nucleotidase [Eikenella sp. NML96-A-049]